MKKWIARVAVASAITGGVLAGVVGPAYAGQWVGGGTYPSRAQCEAVGQQRVNSGMYETYVCERWGGSWSLRGFIN
jgi:hypothetical protein